MINPITATYVLIGMSIFLLIIIPILDSSKKLGKYISLRYVLTTIALLLAVGCVLDFSHLTESSRNTILGGSFILVGLFVIARSLEKIKLGSRGMEFEVKKGGFEAKAKFDSTTTDEGKDHE